jgi:hypothetical protein
MKTLTLLASLLLAAPAALALAFTPALSGDLGPADLTPEQMSRAFPSLGTKWKAFCGVHDVEKECEIELGKSDLIVDATFKVPYEMIAHADSRDAFMAIDRLAKVDPLYTGWQRYRNVNHVRFFKNTVLLSYKSLTGPVSVALFSFPENRISDWYGFANAMRLIALGARPTLDDIK